MCETISGLELFAPAYGTRLVAESSETGIYQYWKKHIPDTLECLEQQFGSFAPLLIGASKGKGSREIQPHNEIGEIFFSIIRECVETGIFSHYLNHGYGLNKLKAIQEEPYFTQKGRELWNYITGRLIDIVGNTGKVWVGIGPLGEGYGDYDQVHIRGKSSKNKLHGMGVEQYSAIRQKNLATLSGLATAGVVMETGHNSREMLGLGKACQQTEKPLITSLYADEKGNIPDPFTKKDIGDMFSILQQELGDTWQGGGLNCVSREVANSLLSKLAKDNPGLLEKFLCLRPNASPGCYNGDYCEKYSTPLSEYLGTLHTQYPYVKYVTGCCGSTIQDLIGILHTKKKSHENCLELV